MIDKFRCKALKIFVEYEIPQKDGTRRQGRVRQNLCLGERNNGNEENYQRLHLGHVSQLNGKDLLIEYYRKT